MKVNQYTRSFEWHRKVYLAIKAGIKIKTIADNFRCSVSTIHHSFSKYQDVFSKEVGTVSLGSKQEPYFTELQMLQGYDVNAVEFSKSELELL